MDLKETSIQIYENNRAKGFWDDRINIPAKMDTSGLFTVEEINAVRSALKSQMLMLVVSEASEALEADRESKYANRKGFEVDQENWNDDNDPVRYKMDFERSIKNSFEDEIADAMIRLMDISVGLGIDLEWHIKAKMKYNSMRPHMHGKKY